MDDRVNSFLFPKQNIRVLSQIISQLTLGGKISPLAQDVALVGSVTVRNLMVLENVEGYASLLENVLRLPSEVAAPKAVAEIPLNLKEKWSWHLFESRSNLTYFDTSLRSYKFLDYYQEQWNHTEKEKFNAGAEDDSFVYSIWEEEKSTEIANSRKLKEDEEVLCDLKYYFLRLVKICLFCNWIE